MKRQRESAATIDKRSKKAAVQEYQAGDVKVPSPRVNVGRMMERQCFRHTVVEVDLDGIDYNMKQIRAMAGPEVAIAAVVKANGYGHGAVALAPILMKNGAACLAVATLSEAIELKEVYPEYPVMILGLIPDDCFPYILKHDIIQSIDSIQQAETLSRLCEAQNKTATIHISIDTGFHRLGFPVNESGLADVRKLMSLPNLIVEGIYSHMAKAGDDENEAQFKLFEKFVNQLKDEGITFRYQHIADSECGLDHPRYRLNMLRVGCLIYGLKGVSTTPLDVRQVLTFKTKIVHISKIKAGEGVSYGYEWKAPRDTLIGTLPFGYADGYPRSMSNKGTVAIRGHKVTIVGLICMDQCMVDLTDVPDAKVGDEAIIYGDGTNGSVTIMEASQWAGTSNADFELGVRLNARAAHIYKSTLYPTPASIDTSSSS